ncbi:RluA family pseudouridine synthase [Candidatus Microgenomates bacterium]|nr:RluA family pseudouridine synthase [Candidatus Microgenomates bacterium]
MQEPQIIYQDDSFMILDKPAGWIVNSAGTTTTQPVIQGWLKDNFDYEISQNDELRSGVVHRLDKETSGVLIIAKTQSSFFELQRQFKERLTHKTYTALAHGIPKELEGIIKASVGRLPWRRDRFGVLQGGRDALTKYKVLKTFEKDKEKYSLFELYPETGRTHQIRIHLKYLGNPIVADNFYAGRKTARRDRLWCQRLFLHASSISFLHPQTKKKVEYKSNLSEDLQQVLNTLN